MQKTLIVLALIAMQANAAPLFHDNIAAGKRPLTYIGKNTKAATTLALTQKTDGGDTVARVAAGSPVTVLLVDNKGHALVKNIFGLTGWAQADTSGAPVDKLDGLQKAEMAKNTFFFYFNPANSKFLNETLPIKGDRPEIYRALRGKFAGDDKEYLLQCDEGMSADPNCTIFPAGDNIPDGPYYGDNTLNGETYYIPGNGYIYTDTRANLFYQTRSKYVLQDGKLSKIKQPYQYIGVNSKAQNSFKLDGLDGKKHAVKKGEKVHIILDDPYAIPCKKDSLCNIKLLLKNSHGNIGWVVPDLVNSEYENPGPKIEYIRFYGD